MFSGSVTSVDQSHEVTQSVESRTQNEDQNEDFDKVMDMETNDASFYFFVFKFKWITLFSVAIFFVVRHYFKGDNRTLFET